jgi:hypothetical protein
MTKNKKSKSKAKSNETKQTPPTIPDNFISIIRDFTRDLSTTFPEYAHLWVNWGDSKLPESEIQNLYHYCSGVYPERFFDILYQNDKIFENDSPTNVMFLPNVDFKILYNSEGLSENTKKAIWKYLQVVLFTIVNSVKDKANFGETMNLFDGINESELQDKLKETFSSIGDFFKNMDFNVDEQAGSTDDANSETKTESTPETETEGGMPNMEDFRKFTESMGESMGGDNPFANMGAMPGMPNAEELHGHLKTLFDGKIGSLAKELAEEISQDFSDILSDESGNPPNTQDVLQKMLKNPKKIMDLMKTVSSKLDSKMKSGEISRDEIMKEASEWMSRMKDMGGKDDFSEILKNLTKSMGGMGGLGGLAGMAGMAGLGKNMKFDTNAFDRMTKQQSQKEGIRSRLEKRQQARAMAMAQAQLQQSKQEPLQNIVFKMDDEGVQEKSYINQMETKNIDEIVADLQNSVVVPGKSKPNKKKKGKK